MTTDSATTGLTEGEQRLINILKGKFPAATYLRVEDISGTLIILKNLVNATCVLLHRKQLHELGFKYIW